MNQNESELNVQGSFSWQRGEFYKTYERILGYYLVQSILEHMRGPSLLDLACGNGLLTNMLFPNFGRVVGVDASSVHIAKARETYPNIKFVCALAEKYKDDIGFSTITMITLLEHVHDPVATLSECVSNLTEEGVIIAHVPNALSVNRRIAKLMGTLKDEYEHSPFDIEVAGHRRSYDMDLLVRDFEMAGLKVIFTGGVFYKMLSQAQINWLLEKGPWEEGGFGWGRIGEEKKKDWRRLFCNACYEYGKQRPQDCNVIYAVGQRSK